MTRTLPLAATTAIALAMALPAQAQYAEEDTGFYVQGGYSHFDLEPEGADSGVDTGALTARAGWQFNRIFSIETELSSGFEDGEFAYNVDEDEFNLDDNDDDDLNDIIAASGDIELNYLLGVYGRASWPVSDRIDIMARAGYAYIDLDASVTTPGGTELAVVEDSADGPAIGAGIAFDLTESIELRGDYTYYDFEDTDTNGFTMALGYKF